MLVPRLALVLVLGWQGCVRQVHMDSPITEPVFTTTFAYQQISNDNFQIWTPTDTGLADAKAALGCGVCVEEPRGILYIYRVQRFRQSK